MVSAHIKKAQLLLEQRRPMEAEKQLAEVLNSDPDNDQALSLLTRCKYDQHQYQQGIDTIQRAIKVYATNDYYFYLLGFGYYQLSKNEDAKQCLQQAVRLNPYASDYFGLHAMVLLEEKRFEEALAKANEGLALDAGNITCLNARSTSLNKLKRTDDAIATMQFALTQDPENDFTHTNAGWNLLEKGRHREAANHFMEALRLNPNLENARSGLKESLKSRIAPYRWLLQYSFWMNNQGRHTRWLVPVGIYLAVRAISGATSSAGQQWAKAGIAVVVVYFLLVFITWIINPLANLMLMFDARGRYAVTTREKYNSILLLCSLLLAMIFFVISMMLPGNETQLSRFLIAAVICLTLSIPLSHMELPVRVRNNSRLQWYSIGLVILGCVALFLSLLAPNAGMVGLTVYGIAFILFTWMNVFSSR